MPPPSDVLRTAKIDVHRITMPLYNLGGFQKPVGVVGSELDDQGPVPGCTFFATFDVKHLGSV